MNVFELYDNGNNNPTTDAHKKSSHRWHVAAKSIKQAYWLVGKKIWRNDDKKSCGILEETDGSGSSWQLEDGSKCSAKYSDGEEIVTTTPSTATPNPHFFIWRDGAEMIVHCPVCDWNCTHIQRVYTLMGSDPDEAEEYKGTKSEGIACGRRSALAIEFNCEAGHTFTMFIQQHKGENTVLYEKGEDWAYSNEALYCEDVISHDEDVTNQ